MRGNDEQTGHLFSYLSPRRSIEQPEAFWAEQAKLLHWEQPFEKVLDYSKP